MPTCRWAFRVRIKAAVVRGKLTALHAYMSNKAQTNDLNYYLKKMRMKGQQNSKYAGKKNSSKHQGRNEDQKKAKTEINLRKYLKLKRRLRQLINL